MLSFGNGDSEKIKDSPKYAEREHRIQELIKTCLDDLPNMV